jgi:hypothetical protein
MLMVDIDDVRSKIVERYLRLKNWQKVADEFGLSKGTIYKVAMYQDYEPKRIDILDKLGLKPSTARVRSINGTIPDGSQALGALVCSCGQPFISNHPRRRKCFICSKYRGKRRT